MQTQINDVPTALILAEAARPQAGAEVARLRELIEQRRQGSIDEVDFRRFRVLNGVYGIRGQPDVHMLRVRIPGGALTAGQLDGLGAIAEEFAGGLGHLTTRQDVQFHGVALAAVPEVLERLATLGLTTREAGGNIVRNVTACPLAGVCAQEAFDVTPHAAALAAHLLRNPACQALPRKFKIAFSGCSRDCALAAIHDLGAVAVPRGTEIGFQVYVGGGLGSAPQAAQLLEAFTSANDLVLTVVAVVRVFDRLGNRQNRSRARLKFVVKDLGIEWFRELVSAERKVLWAAWPGALPLAITAADIAADGLAVDWPWTAPEDPSADERRWLVTNVVRQRQAGHLAAYVTVPGGDLTSEQFRLLAELLRTFPGLELRTTATQNVVLRWAAPGWLPVIYSRLAQAGLGRAGVHGPSDVLGCPGADTCNLALTKSHRQALELGRQLYERVGAAELDELAGVTLKVSGCPNACGHHHVASIGLYGASRRINGRQVPCYQLLLGGGVAAGTATFGRPVLRVPARRAPEAILRLINHYRSRRAEGQGFDAWWRADPDGHATTVAALLSDLVDLPPFETSPELYFDWGDEAEFKVQVGQGECAA